MKNLWWFCLSSLLFLASCGWRERAIPVELAQADSLMEVRPDSAMAYLASLDSFVQGEPEYVRMYYALQQIKAQDKCYIPHTSDSVILSLVRYYTDNGTPDQQMEAYHYLGSVYRDMGDAPRAVEAYQKAADIGKESGSKRNDILGRTYEQIGYLFAYQGLYDEGLKAYRTSYYYNVNRPKGKIYALRNIARMHNAKNNIDSAVYYYKRAYEEALSIKDQSIIDNMLSELSYIYTDKKEYDVAKEIFNHISDKNDPNYTFGLGCIHQDSMHLDSAIYYFKQANKYGNIYMRRTTNYILAEIEKLKGNPTLALDYALSSIHLSDTIRYKTKTEAVAKVNALYNYQRIEKENNRLRIENDQKKIRNYQLILFIIILLITGIEYFSLSNKRKKEAIEKERKLRKLKEEQYERSMDSLKMNEQEISKLETQLQQAEMQKDSLREQLIHSQKELLELSNRKILASQNERELLEIALHKSDIYRLFHEAGSKVNIRITDKEWTNLQNSIDATYSNFTSQLYALYPKISTQELHICYLIKISIPVKDIAKILGRSTSAITVARIRLYKKIHGEDGSAEMMDKFIADL